LGIDERIFDYLLGEDYIDSRLRGIVQPLSVAALTPQPGSLSLVKQLCEREWRLSQSVLLVDGDEMEEGINSGLSELIETINLPLMVSRRERGRQRMRSLITWEVQPPTAEEQQAIWQGALGEKAVHLEAEIEALVSQFQLSVRDIYTVCLRAQTSLDAEIANKEAAIATPAPEPEPVAETKPKRKRRTTRKTTTETPPPKPVTLEVAKSPLWEICRIQARPQLQDLAVRIETTAEWEDYTDFADARETLRVGGERLVTLISLRR
jgi:hypothetical protein